MHAHNSLVGVILSERMRAYQVNVTHIRRDERTGARDRKAPSAHRERARERNNGWGKKRRKLLRLRSETNHHVDHLFSRGKRRTSEKHEDQLDDGNKQHTNSDGRIKYLFHRWSRKVRQKIRSLNKVHWKTSVLCQALEEQEMRSARNDIYSKKTLRRKPNAHCDYLFGRSCKRFFPIVGGESLE